MCHVMFVLALVISPYWEADLENAISPYVPWNSFNFWEYDNLPRKEVLWHGRGNVIHDVVEGVKEQTPLCVIDEIICWYNLFGKQFSNI